MIKKGQMEMVGLVVIVILITLGMLFMATFALKNPEQKKIFTRKGLAYSTMSSVMKTSISYEAACAQGVIGIAAPKLGKDIIEDCANFQEGNSIYQCKSPLTGDNVHSCVFVQDMIKYLLNESLGGWNKRYEFQSRLVPYIGVEPTPLFPAVTGNKGCRNRERDTSGLFPINTEAGLIENVLYICD